MPTYEYKCKSCGKVFDVLQSIKARPLTRTKCEICGKTSSVTRQIGTGGAVIFKGSGFYQTDYRSDSYKKSASAASAESDSKSKPTGDSGKEAKPVENAASESKPAKDAPKSSGESTSSTGKSKKAK
jgi:putative FmdB family regulatory protein